MSECSPESVGGSPCRRADFKRDRDEDAENLGAMPRPRSARMATTPCRTPVQSPNIYGAARMCLTTPLCSTPVSSMSLVQRSELGLRWGSAYSPGPRRWRRCLVLSLTSALPTHPLKARHKRALHCEPEAPPPLPVAAVRKRIDSFARLTRAAARRMHTLASSMVTEATQSRYIRCAPAPLPALQPGSKALTVALAARCRSTAQCTCMPTS